MEAIVLMDHVDLAITLDHLTAVTSFISKLSTEHWILLVRSNRNKQLLYERGRTMSYNQSTNPLLLVCWEAWGERRTRSFEPPESSSLEPVLQSHPPRELLLLVLLLLPRIVLLLLPRTNPFQRLPQTVNHPVRGTSSHWQIASVNYRTFREN